MGQHACARGIGELIPAIRKVLHRRTCARVFYDAKRTAPTFQVAGTGPELTTMEANPQRFLPVGTYDRAFSTTDLLADANEALREFSPA